MDKMVLEVLSKYGIRPQKCTLIRNKGDRSVWKVEEKKGKFVLKLVSAEKAQKISNVTLFLSGKGIPVIPVVPTLKGDFVVRSKKNFFVLFPWFDGDAISYRTPGTIEKMSVLLAQFHEASRGFQAAGKPIKKTELNLLKEYSRKVEQLDKIYKKVRLRKDPIVNVFLDHYSWLRKRCAWVINTLPNTSYYKLLKLVDLDPILIHGDYAKYNILSDNEGDWKIIDLDDVEISFPLKELSKMMSRIDCKLGNWSLARYQSILQCYRSIRPFSEEEEELLLLDLCFPDRILNLMNKYDRKAKDKAFLEEFKSCLAIDKEKIKELSIKDLEWGSS